MTAFYIVLVYLGLAILTWFYPCWFLLNKTGCLPFDWFVKNVMNRRKESYPTDSILFCRFLFSVFWVAIFVLILLPKAKKPI